MVLSTTEPNNNVGMIKVRKYDAGTQIFDVTITENGKLKDFTGLTPFFCVKSSPKTGLGISERIVTDIVDAENGRLKYTLTDYDMQHPQTNHAYFAFKKLKDEETFELQFTTKDFRYTTIASIFDPGIHDSNYIWTFEEMLRIFKEWIELAKSDFEEWDKEAREKIEQIIKDFKTWINENQEEYAKWLQDNKDSWADFVEQNKDILEAIDPGGEILVALGTLKSFRSWDKDLISKMRNEFDERGANVKWFGAVGDGVTDDGAAIKKAHIYANEHKTSVFYPKSIYYISETSEIPVKTCVDFNGSTIIINDNPTVDNKVAVYKIEEDSEPKTYENDSIPTSLKSKFYKNNKSSNIELSAESIRFLEIFDHTKKVYARYGANGGEEGQALTDIVRIDKDGAFIDQLTYNFTNVTKIIEHEIPKVGITIKNGNFKSVGENIGSKEFRDWYMRGIMVNRSNVLFDNIYHELDDFDGKQASEGFIKTYSCCQIQIKNSKFQPHLSYESKSSNSPDTMVYGGTYELVNTMTLDIVYDNVIAYSQEENIWGAHGGNLNKKVKFTNCQLNRIDSHLPTDTLEITGCTIGRYGVTVVGYGDLIIKDCIFNSDIVLNFREDYGSFWNGNVIIENLYHTPISWHRLFNITPHLDWDFGIKVRLGYKNIVVKNYIVDDNNILDKTLFLLQASNGVFSVDRNYYFADNFEFENCKRLSGHGFKLFFLPIWDRFRVDQKANHTIDGNGVVDVKTNINICLKNMSLNNKDTFLNSSWDSISSLIQPLNSEFYGENVLNYGNQSLVPYFKIENCTNVFASVFSLKCKLDIFDSEVCGLITSKGDVDNRQFSKVCLDRCSIHPKVYAPAIKNNNDDVIHGSKENTIFKLCFFSRPLLSTGEQLDAQNSRFRSIYKFLEKANANQTFIDINAVFNNCDFTREAFLDSIFNDFKAFETDLRNYDRKIYRKFGVGGYRPVAPEYMTTYLNTENNILAIWAGTQWIQVSK